MKSIEFSEDQLGNLEELGKQLFGDENDPRSMFYKRVLNRPRISWLRIAAFVLLPVLLLAALGIFACHMGAPTGVCWWVGIGVYLLYCIVMVKPAILCGIRIYQRYAPASLRNKCRFEPSCSEYMCQAIEKYGLFRGIRKGTNRLSRCNVDGGGYDAP